MTGPRRELRTPANTVESPRTRAIRILGDRQDGDTAWVAALLHIGDQLARIADHLPEAGHHLDQITAAVADIAHGIEKLIPEEDQ